MQKDPVRKTVIVICHVASVAWSGIRKTERKTLKVGGMCRQCLMIIAGDSDDTSIRGRHSWLKERPWPCTLERERESLTFHKRTYDQFYLFYFCLSDFNNLSSLFIFFCMFC